MVVSHPTTCVQLTYEALKQAWTALDTTESNVLKLYVTQDSAADVAVDELVLCHLFTKETYYVPVAVKYNNMSDELRGNHKVALAALTLHEPSTKLNIPPALCKNKQVALQVASVLGRKGHQPALAAAHPNLQKDKNFVLAALSLDSSKNMRYVPKFLLEDRDVVLAGMRQQGKHFAYFSFYAASFMNDRDVVLAAVSSCGLALGDVLPVFQNDKEVVLTALRSSGYDRDRVLQFASPALQKDSDVLALMQM